MLDDLLAGVEKLVHEGDEKSLAHLNFDPQRNFGTGLPASRLVPSGDLTFNNPQLPPDTGEGLSQFSKWHRAFGKALNPAAGPAAMAAIGAPVAGFLGRGAPAGPQTENVWNTVEEHPLANPQDTFGTTSRVDRFLRMDLNEDMSGTKGYAKLAKDLHGNESTVRYLRGLGEKMLTDLPSWRQYARHAQDPHAGAKAVAMLVSQVEFADEATGFEFIGQSAPKILKEWHRVATGGNGNEDLATFGLMQFARAVEWVQHPELLVSPSMALSYMSFDDEMPVVGMRVAQWQGKDVEELTDADVKNRVAALENLHPSGVVESLVDNVRQLVEVAMGGPYESLEEHIGKFRMQGSPLDLKEVGHVAGLNRPAPSTKQMRAAIGSVAREAGRIDDQMVTPEEINALAKAGADEYGTPLAGLFVDLITGEGLPGLDSFANIDASTDVTLYRDRPRNIRMEATSPRKKSDLTVTVESASDGSFKVMSEDGTAFRNRAVGFIRHSGRQATVPRKPSPVMDVNLEFNANDNAGAYFPVQPQEQPAFSEGPQVMLSFGTDSAPDQIIASLEGQGLSVGRSSLPPHSAKVRVDGEVLKRPERSEVFSYETVADLHLAVESASEDEDIAQLLSSGAAVMQVYVNTSMDAPPGMVEQWEQFTNDERGRMASAVSTDGLGSRTDMVPHWRLPTQVESSVHPTGSGFVQSLDDAEPWSEGDTIYIHMPAYDEGPVPSFSHDPEAMGADESRWVTATRRSNGNVVVGVPASEGKVEVMLAKQAHELMRNLGRNSVSVVTRE
jgi:hypothetical protein